MSRAVRAGAAYFAAMFALGFLLGTARVLWLAPRAGAWGAVLIETPVMLAASWFVCGRAVRRWRVPADTPARLAMGAVAFVLLIGAETALGVIGFGRTLAEQGAAFRSPEGLTGLAAQLVFAAFPLVRR